MIDINQITYDCMRYWSDIDEKISSWDGEKVRESEFFNIVYSHTDSIYKVDTETSHVFMSENHGFWLDNNEEVRIPDIKVGETKVYVIKDGKAHPELITSVTKIEDGFVMPDIIGAEYKNYIVNNIILHNFDNYEYVDNLIAGAGNIEVDCNVWEAMFATAKSTFDAHMKSVSELMGAAYGSYCVSPAPGGDNIEDFMDKLREVSEKYWKTAYPKYIDKMYAFFNSLVCPANKETGTVLFDTKFVPVVWKFEDNIGSGDFIYRWSTINGPVPPGGVGTPETIDVYIDYGDGEFSEQKWLDHQQALHEYICELRRSLEVVGIKYVPAEPYIKDDWVVITPVGGRSPEIP